MKEDLLRIRTDLAFKAVYGRNTKECREALIKLLETLLNVNIKNLVYKNPFNINRFEDEKETEFDIHVELNDGQNVDVEIQLRPQLSFNERLAYYNAKLLAGSVSKGDYYEKLRKSIVIAILDFDMFPGTKEYKKVFHFREEKSSMRLTDIMEIVTLEMVKINENIKKMADDEKYLYYLKYVGEKGYEDNINKIIEESEGLQMATEILREVSADEIMRSALISKEKYEKDKHAELMYAKMEGITEGIEKGIEKGIENTIMILIKHNFDDSEIIKAIKEEYNLDEGKAAEKINAIKGKA